MSRLDKLVQKLCAEPTTKTMKWREMKTLLSLLGYKMHKRSGSRRHFYNERCDHVIKLHKPHPSPDVKAYAVREVREVLVEQGVINCE